MPLLFSRQHSFSTIQEKAPQGWAFCMSKAYCKWPAIAGIIIGILAFILILWACLRCCNCCGMSRGRRQRKRATTQPSMFNPMPYQGYQPANADHAPPPYNEPPRFAQFDNPNPGNRKVTEDTLPAMPQWEQSQNRKVADDVELGRIEPQQKAPMLVPGANASTAHMRSYSEVDSHPVQGPFQLPAHPSEVPTGYTGPDFGHGAGAPPPAHPYTGPDFGVGQGQPTGYSAYAPSQSTVYEPSGVNEPQELGTTYSHTLPPPSPSAQQPGFQHAPSVLQAGRKPGVNGNSWKDV